MADLGSFTLTCPRCRSPLEQTASDELRSPGELRGPGQLRCPTDGLCFPCQEGIWRFLLPEREAHYQQFMREYQAVRQAEGRGSADPQYYQALPDRDLSGRFSQDWRIRARSFHAFVDGFLQPLEARSPRPLKILDLGSGNGWLAHQLARRGHRVAAVDLQTNVQDGLGAFIHYPVAYLPVQAEFDRLPFAEGQIDLAIFNSSLHYSTGYNATLAEALRLLVDSGNLVILDTPIYHDPSSGAQMLEERQALFTQRYGFPSNALQSEGYLTDEAPG